MNANRPASLTGVIGTAVLSTLLVLVAAAAPARATPSFPAAEQFGFAPNTAGGNGELGSTLPYAASTSPTLFLHVPYEVAPPFNGSDDTTVDLRVVVPAGWTKPACAAATTSVNNASTNNTDQPGGPVAGWTCEILVANGRQVVHFSGPQVQSPATFAASVQFFAFQATTPSSGNKTTYDGTNGAEGFVVDQRAASGTTKHWIPNAAFPGHPPVGSTTVVAPGLARTVAAAQFLAYTPIQPSRILDTRNGTGLSGGFGSGAIRELTVINVGGVPATARDVVLNVTVTGASSPSDLRLWPFGQPVPDVSNLNWVAGQTIPNLVKVRVGTDGKVSIRNNQGSVQVIADVVGYYAVPGSTPGFGPQAAADDVYTPIQPARILDTRDGTGLTGPFGAGQTRALTVANLGGPVPANATAVALNVTVTGATHHSDLRLWPTGQPQPEVSNLNWTPGETIPNLAIVKVGTNGQVSIRNNEGSVQVIGDVVGYYTPPSVDFAPSVDSKEYFTALQPSRILDTRDGTGLSGPFSADQTRNLTVRGPGGIPNDATAVVINMTVTGSNSFSDLRLWPTGQAQPGVSNLNWAPGQTIPNLVVVKVGTNGQVSIRNNEGSVDVIGDVVGYFTGGSI